MNDYLGSSYLIWGVFPYVALTLFFVVPFIRMVYRPFGMSTRASGIFLGRDILGLAAHLLHWGIFLVFFGHLAGLIGGILGWGELGRGLLLDGHARRSGRHRRLHHRPGAPGAGAGDARHEPAGRLCRASLPDRDPRHRHLPGAGPSHLGRLLHRRALVREPLALLAATGADGLRAAADQAACAAGLRLRGLLPLHQADPRLDAAGQLSRPALSGAAHGGEEVPERLGAGVLGIQGGHGQVLYDLSGRRRSRWCWV